LRASRLLAVLVLVDALILAVGHVPIIRAIFFSFSIGAYFVFAIVVYVVGGILVLAGKLYRLANFGLIILAVVDNILLIYTRTMPNIFFQRIIPWSWEWFPPGTGQIFIGQVIIIVLCAILLYKPDMKKPQQPVSPAHT
jgi:hypothetical protein